MFEPPDSTLTISKTQQRYRIDCWVDLASLDPTKNEDMKNHEHLKLDSIYLPTVSSFLWNHLVFGFLIQWCCVDRRLSACNEWKRNYEEGFSDSSKN